MKVEKCCATPPSFSPWQRPAHEFTYSPPMTNDKAMPAMPVEVMSREAAIASRADCVMADESGKPGAAGRF